MGISDGVFAIERRGEEREGAGRKICGVDDHGESWLNS